MKLIPYNPFLEDDIEIYFKYSLENEKLQKKLKEIYGEEELFFHFNNLNQIRKIINPENKKILDLGCGSIHESDNFVYKPWLSRGLYELNSKIIGIDINDNSKEKFENYQIDLTKKDSLNLFQKNSIDIACAFSFFDAPSLKKSQKTFKNLIDQLEKIIKPEGYFIFHPFGL
jgi:SAM-dependent methyltransferase